MKYLIVTILTGCSLFNSTFAQQPNGYRIAGHIRGADTGTVVLQYVDHGIAISDTTHMENGQFSFTGKVEDPARAMLTCMAPAIFEEFFIENTEMQVNGEKGSSQPNTITGSATNDEYAVFKKVLDSLNAQAWKAWQGVQALAKTDSALAARKQKEEVMPLYDKIPAAIHEYILSHPKSWLSLAFLYNKQGSMDSKEVQRILAGMAPAIQQSVTGRKIMEMTSGKLKTAVGSSAPVFTQPDVSGKAVSLKDYRGKYVLIDFWASWCGPCRQENPALVKALTRYKGKGFAILSVSLDNNKQYWLEAIKKDDMQWANVCDLKGTNNAAALLYGITSIPSSFLVDPRGTIIASGLRGKALEEKLATVFGE